MTGRALANDICRSMPGATWSESFGPGHDVWKVGGKMFAVMGAVDDAISLKCPDADTADMLRAAGVGTRAPYFNAVWIRMPLDDPDADELRHRIAVSYDTIRAGLTKAAQAALPAEAR